METTASPAPALPATPSRSSSIPPSKSTAIYRGLTVRGVCGSTGAVDEPVHRASASRPGVRESCATATTSGWDGQHQHPEAVDRTATGIQTADNTPVIDVDLTDTFINAPVRTISGQQAVAIQLLDQSPIAFDDLVFRDLTADYASQLDKQCLYGSGTNGQVLGVNNAPNIGTIAVSTVDIKGVYSAIANAIQLVHTTRFQPPEVVVMHPRRWGWFLSLLDANQRPLFLPDANRPYNAAGILEEVASQQVVGSIQGLPVVTDPNIRDQQRCRHRGHRVCPARIRRRAVGVGNQGQSPAGDPGAETSRCCCSCTDT